MSNNTPSPKKKSEEISPQTSEKQYAIHPVTGEKHPFVPTKTGDKFPVAMLGGLPGAHRPTKCDIDLTIQICNSLRHGAYIETACEAAGIHTQKYYEWMKYADRDEQAGKPPGFHQDKGESPYIAFRDSVKISFHQAENNLLEKIHNGEGDKTWMRLAWILERTRQQRYGQRQQVDVTHTVAGPDVPPPASTYDAWIERRNSENAALQDKADDAEYKEL